MQFGVREANWLTAERIRAYCAMMLAGYAIVIGYTFLSANGLLDAFGRPLGTDFANVWTAGTWVLDGQPAAPFDPVLHQARQLEIFQTPDKSYFGWHYPPMFLAIATLLALMPYIAALIVWQIATLPLYLTVISRIIPWRVSILAALAFPAVLVNLLHGHNGFLTAGLIGGGLLVLPNNPIAAGVLFGLLSYKPQFALAIPVALIAGGYWRTALSAAATAVAVAGLSWIAFGTGAWAAFFHFSEFTRQVVLEQGNTGWHKIQSVFAAVRMHGGSIAAAYAAQTAVTISILTGLFLLWRSDAAHSIKSAALLVAVLLSTPYVLDYDFMILGPAIAFMVQEGLKRGFLPYEKIILATCWLMPLFARFVGAMTSIHIGVVALLALFGLCIAKSGFSYRQQGFVHG